MTKNYFSLKAAQYHYYGTANSTYNQYLQGEFIEYKKYFYALRPLLACRYIQEYKCPPPVLFDDLMKIKLPEVLRNGIAELLEIKKKSNEGERNMQIPVIRDFIAVEIVRQKIFLEGVADDRKPEWKKLNECFQNVLLKIIRHFYE